MAKKQNNKTRYGIFKYFENSNRGAIVIIAAIVFPIILGFIGLGIDVGMWYTARRAMQKQADAAAIGGAIELSQSSTFVVQRAKADAARNGFVTQTSGDIMVNTPPSTGPHAGNSSAVEVILTQQQPLFFSTFFISYKPTVTTRAVALIQKRPACFLSLGPFIVSGNASLNMTCGMQVDSPADPALTLQGSATLIATYANVVGTYKQIGGGQTIQVPGPNDIKTGGNPVNDPFTDLTIPAQGTPITFDNSIQVQTINPGTYVGGISLGSHSVLTMNPGVYIIAGSSFTASSQATINGTGVTIILTQNAGTYATINFAAGAAANLTAPTTGTYAGFVIITDRNAPSQDNTLGGGANQNISGKIYMPTQSLTYGGNAGTDIANCSLAIAQQFTLKGTSGISNGCIVPGINDSVTLVE